MVDREIIQGALQLACQAQNINRINTGRKVLKALIGNKQSQLDKLNINNIEETAFKYLDFDDEWEYRRYLELIKYLALSELYSEAIKKGKQSTNQEVNDVAEEWKDLVSK